MKKYSYVYILSNYSNTTLYIGVTSNLVKRIWEHKQKLSEGFTQRYHINKLVYYEQYENIEEAIIREKQLKGGSRKKKIQLIQMRNPDWQDLYEKLF